MATATRPVPSLQITAAHDTMTLQSANGLDFGDGDGDIDLDLQSNGQRDDDVSLYDAGTDAGLDVQTTLTDQDDFMADHEDLIEEDVIIYDIDDDVIDTDQQSTAYMVTQQQEVANPEEDLIDYSDDEEQPSWTDNPNASGILDTKVGQDISTVDEVTELTLVGESSIAVDPTIPKQSSQEGDYNIPRHNLVASTQEWPDQGHHGDGSYVENDEEEVNQEKYYAEEHAPSQEEQTEELHQVFKKDHMRDQSTVASGSHGGVTHEPANKDLHETRLHPITVNYDGTELWLFKYDDYDGSGDFLVENELLADEPISSLLEACRTALGSDITDDMELGFRFDNFHNVELYQEHTSCAFVTLEHMVKLYVQLHVQDGISNPESFYMSLLIRPRVSALLSELNKAAAEGIGHTGLGSAIAAGQTAFNAVSSRNSTKHTYEDWEHDEQQLGQGPHDGAEPGEQRLRDGEHYEHHDEEYNNEQHDQQSWSHQQQTEESNNEVMTKPQVHDQDGSPRVPPMSSIMNAPAEAGGKTANDVNPDAQGVLDQLRNNSQTSHHEEDVIDYSEDEGDVEDTRPDLSETHQSSSASATLQGDEQASAQDAVPDSVGHDDYIENGSEAAHAYEGEFDGDFAQLENIDSAYEGFDGAFETNEDSQQAREEEVAAAQELEDYAADYGQAYGDDTNQYDNFEEENVEQATDLSLLSFAHDGKYTVEDNFAEADDFLDLGMAVTKSEVATADHIEGVSQKDEIDYDDEDGAVVEAPVAASAAADPVATSSLELVDLSPQGQKRTIDEVGNDVDKASDLSDAKRPRV